MPSISTTLKQGDPMEVLLMLLVASVAILIKQKKGE